jgi:putative aminopeptidase FrvX
VLRGIVSVPCRYIHSPFSTYLLSDIDHTWRLLAAFCRAAPGDHRTSPIAFATFSRSIGVSEIS